MPVGNDRKRFQSGLRQLRLPSVSDKSGDQFAAFRGGVIPPAGVGIPQFETALLIAILGGKVMQLLLNIVDWSSHEFRQRDRGEWLL